MAIVKRSGISYAVTLALLPAALIVGCAGNDKLTRLDSSELKTPEVVTDAVTNETVELQDNFAFVQIAPPLVGHGVNSEISVNDAELSVQEEPLAKMVAEQELVDVVLTPAEPEYPRRGYQPGSPRRRQWRQDRIASRQYLEATRRTARDRLALYRGRPGWRHVNRAGGGLNEHEKPIELAHRSG